MKRQIGTALSVVGLLAVGAGAATLNAHVLHSANTDPGRIVVRTVGGMTMMNATTGLPSPEAPGAAAPLASAVATTSVVSNTANAKAKANANIDTATAGRGGAMMDRMRDRVAAVTGGPTDATSRLRMMTSLTPEQRDLLRIAAMARVSPREVLAAAKGQAVDASNLATIESVAAYIGVDLKSLANVTSLPRMMDRGHGGPNDHGGMNFDN